MCVHFVTTPIVLCNSEESWFPWAFCYTAFIESFPYSRPFALFPMTEGWKPNSWIWCSWPYVILPNPNHLILILIIPQHELTTPAWYVPAS